MHWRFTSPSLSQSLDQIDARLSREDSSRVLPRPIRWGLHIWALLGMFIAGSAPAVLLAFVCMLLRGFGLPESAALGLYGLGVLSVAMLFVRVLVMRRRSRELNVEASLLLGGLVLFAPFVWFSAAHAA